MTEQPQATPSTDSVPSGAETTPMEATAVQLEPALSPELEMAPVNGGLPPRRWRFWLAGLLCAVIVAVVGIGVYYPELLAAVGDVAGIGHSTAVAHPSARPSPGDEPAKNEALPVTTVHPQRKTLERTIEQPGTIVPWAQAELYAKASGYVKLLGADSSPEMASELVGQEVALRGVSPLIGLAPQVASVSVEVAATLRQAPEKDIGSRVRAGEVLLQIDAPELYQDIREKQSLLAQAGAELEEARTLIPTLEATIRVVQTQELMAQSDIRRYQSEHTYRTSELKRTQEVARDRLVAQELVDEKLHQVNAALAAWESSKLKAEAAKADYSVASSKLSTAQADIKLKEAKVQVARAAVNRAEIVADYATLRAPFDGIITYRGVDDGDFVQNASGGQPKPLLTVTAIDKVKVVLQVREQDAMWIQLGARATLQVDARNGWKAHGRVSRTGGTLAQKELTLQVEIDVDNRDHKLMPGMYAQTELTLQRIEQAMAIPSTAVFSRGGENYILQVVNGEARRQKVRIRFDDGKELEVVKLTDGKEVPLDGTEELVISNKGEIGDRQAVQTVAANGP